MLSLTKIKEILTKKSGSKNSLKHVIINLFPFITTDERKAADYRAFLNLVKELLDMQVEKDIPIFTINLGKASDIADQTALSFFCDEILEKAKESKINVTIFGRWYELTGELVEALKVINNETKEYDSFFFNICINYDSRQEIADGCRVLIRKVLDDKADVDSITPELLKENIYSSYFVPPDIIIEAGDIFSGTFMFDSVNSRILFLHKAVSEINKADILKVLDY